MAEHGLDDDDRIVVADLHGEGHAEGAALHLLGELAPAERPTALFCAQNRVTVGAVRALRRLGLQDQVAVVGFDDFPLADLLVPGVTVIAQDPVAHRHGRRPGAVRPDRGLRRAPPDHVGADDDGAAGLGRAAAARLSAGAGRVSARDEGEQRGLGPAARAGPGCTGSCPGRRSRAPTTTAGAAKPVVGGHADEDQANSPLA